MWYVVGTKDQRFCSIHSVFKLDKIENAAVYRSLESAKKSHKRMMAYFEEYRQQRIKHFKVGAAEAIAEYPDLFVYAVELTTPQLVDL